MWGLSPTGISISSHTLSSSLTPLLTLPEVTLVWLEGQNKSEWIWCKQLQCGKSVALVSFPKCLKRLSLKMSSQPESCIVQRNFITSFCNEVHVAAFFSKLFFSEGKVWPQLTPGSLNCLRMTFQCRPVHMTEIQLKQWEKCNWYSERNTVWKSLAGLDWLQLSPYDLAMPPCCQVADPQQFALFQLQLLCTFRCYCHSLSSPVGNLKKCVRKSSLLENSCLKQRPYNVLKTNHAE